MLFSVLKRLAALFVCCCIALGACSVFAEESWTCHLCGFEACSNYCANCGAKKREQALDVFYETALKESRRLVEFCGVESLAKLYTNSEEVLALVRSFADEHKDTDPERALVLYLDCAAAKDILPILDQLSGYDLSALYEYRRSSLPAMLHSLINARQGGMVWLSASGIATISSLFSFSDLPESMALVLLDYGEDKGMVCVTFYVSPIGATIADAGFLPQGYMSYAAFDLCYSLADSSLPLSGLLSDIGDVGSINDKDLRIIAQLIPLIKYFRVQAY